MTLKFVMIFQYKLISDKMIYILHKNFHKKNTTFNSNLTS